MALMYLIYRPVLISKSYERQKSVKQHYFYFLDYCFIFIFSMKYSVLSIQKALKCVSNYKDKFMQVNFSFVEMFITHVNAVATLFAEGSQLVTALFKWGQVQNRVRHAALDHRPAFNVLTL